MLSPAVRKVLANARMLVHDSLKTRSRVADLNALANLDQLLLAHVAEEGGVRIMQAQAEFVHSDDDDDYADSQVGEPEPDIPAPIPSKPDIPAPIPSKPDSRLLREIQSLHRQREQDSEIIEGLRSELAKLREAQRGR